IQAIAWIASRTRSINSGMLIGGVLTLDTFILSGILYFSGGPFNPFSIAYLVLVVLSAVLLNKYWTWFIAFFSSICFSSLFWFYKPLAVFSHGVEHGTNLHLQGMLVSYIVVASCLTYFLSRIIDERRHSQERLYEYSLRTEQLRIIATVTANAAHELSTPLASIDLIVHEMFLNSCANANPDGFRMKDDLQLLKSQIARCKQIIGDLCSKAGNVTGGSPCLISPISLLSEAVHLIGGRGVVIENQAQDLPLVILQKEPILVALRALVGNAIEASEAKGGSPPVSILAQIEQNTLIIVVTDHGCGMSKETLQRVREPFFTTKEQGQGMGLGAYIASLVVEQLGGKIDFESQVGLGTRVVLSIPISINRSNNFAEAA
ncbi:MAG: HAMP domain-containing histidine kinase, partial [Bdellovibrionales bacterium]|nr:HAMP domain-containing histidine kinase [Bdellovibrionales bacterium]